MSTALQRKPTGEDNPCFLRALPLGRFSLRPMLMPDDAQLVHGWVTSDHARFWNMADKTLAEVEAFYAALVSSTHAMAYIGLYDGEPGFLVERYDPAFDQISEHYEVQPGDRGMHVLVAPAATPITGFTFAVMRTVMDYMFAYPSVLRVVVEPDIRNDKIHALNRRVGFHYDRPVTLREKTAHLAFCTREDYVAALADESCLRDAAAKEARA